MSRSYEGGRVGATRGVKEKEGARAPRVAEDREAADPAVALVGELGVRDPVRRREVDGLAAVEAVGEARVERLGERDDELARVLAELVDGHVERRELGRRELRVHVVEQVRHLLQALLVEAADDVLERARLVAGHAVPPARVSGNRDSMKETARETRAADCLGWPTWW